MISKEEFDRIYPKELTPVDHKCLEAFLQGKTDKAIASSRGVNSSSTVGHQIITICNKFGIKNEPGERNKIRDDLVPLFIRYKPELVCDELKKKFGAKIHQPKSNSEIERPEIEEYYQILSKPGALLRLTGNRQSGKTTLMHQVLSRFKNEGQRTVYLSLRLVDSSDLDNLDLFLQWLCNQVSREMQLPSEVADYWDDTTGSKMKCSNYFEEYLLPNQNSPLVLCLDDFHKVYPGKITIDICNMLRSWLDKSNQTTNPIWQNFRMILIYPAEVPTPEIIKDSSLFSLPHERVLPDIN